MKKIGILTVLLVAATGLSSVWAADPPPAPPPPPSETGAVDLALSLSKGVDARIKNIAKATKIVVESHAEFATAKTNYATRPTENNKTTLLNAAKKLGDAIATLKRNSKSLENDIDGLVQDADSAIDAEIKQSKSIKKYVPKNQNSEQLMKELENRLKARRKQ